jgi:hypothetical protein
MTTTTFSRVSSPGKNPKNKVGARSTPTLFLPLLQISENEARRKERYDFRVYSRMPAATAKFKELTLPLMGMDTVRSQAAICSCESPFCSLPSSNNQGGSATLISR